MEEQDVVRIVKQVLENYTFEVETPQQQQPQPKKCVGPNCNHAVKPSETYCEDCLTCESCGTVTKAEDEYCEGCNEPLNSLK